jgi:AAA+ ATPase superfamily predicted ATPase
MSPVQLRRDLTSAIWRLNHPDDDLVLMPTFDTWRPIFRYAAEQAAGRRVVLILDEFPYAIESDPALASELQHAWDHDLKETNLFLVVGGSHIGMMLDLFSYHAPLYGRMTGQLHVKPLPFSALSEFYPRYPAAERLTVYAILGGVPAYLERFNDTETLAANVQREMVSATGIFRAEPFFLINELVKEPRNYIAVLRAIGEGNHTLDAITLATGLDKSHASTYLDRLQTLYLVERQVPATMPPQKRTTQGRYRLADAYLRFFFRFVAPYQALLEKGQAELMWQNIQDQLRAFVGMTAFEELCREWVWTQRLLFGLAPWPRPASLLPWPQAAGRAGQDRPFLPQQVGAHWSSDAQVDVAAVNWQDKALLLGECKWGTDPVGCQVVTELIEDKTPKVRATLPDKGEGWTVYYAFFARAGFTDAAQAEAQAYGALLIDLATLDRDLARQDKPATG